MILWVHTGQLQIERTAWDGTHSEGRKTRNKIKKESAISKSCVHTSSKHNPRMMQSTSPCLLHEQLHCLHLHSPTHTSHCFFFFSFFGESNFPFTFTNHFTIISASHNTISLNIFKHLSLLLRICRLTNYNEFNYKINLIKHISISIQFLCEKETHNYY